MSDDLVQFLRARLDEDERVARAAEPGPWNADGGSVYAKHPTDEVVDYTDSAEHIARHDPARVLAEVDAKRQIVDAYLPSGKDPHPGLACINYEGQDPADYTEYDSCSRHIATSARLLRSDYVLRLLALPYADHPDYKEEWKP